MRPSPALHGRRFSQPGFARRAAGAVAHALAAPQALIDSPEITRTIINFKRLLLTDLTVEIGKIPNKKTLAEAIKTAGEPPGTLHTRGPAAAGAVLASRRAPPPFWVPRLWGGARGGAALTLLRGALHARRRAGPRGEALRPSALLARRRAGPRGEALRPSALLAFASLG